LGIHFYIYYRVEIREVPAMAAAVEAVQAIVQGSTGVAGRLLKRFDDPFTWMEVYENVAEPAEFEAQLEALVEEFGLDRYLAPNARRNLERFEG
jgi:hypothetical protein